VCYLNLMGLQRCPAKAIVKRYELQEILWKKI